MKKISQLVKKHKVITAVLVIAAAFLLVILLRPQSPTLGYSEETVAKRDIVTYNSFVGNVGFTTEMNALAKASAQITEVLVEVGDAVSKGDVLARLDSTTLEDNIEKTEIALKTQTLANEHSLADAQRAYDNFKYALDNGLNASVNGAKAQLDSAQKNCNTLLDNYSNYIFTLEAVINSGYENEASAMINAKKNYDDAKRDYEQLKATIEALENQPENKEYIFLESYKARLVGLEQSVATKLEAYKTRVRNYADKNDANFKAIVDNLENAQIALGTATDSYNATVLQIEQQLESYEAALNKARDTLSLESAQKDLQMLKDTLKDYEIVAPCDGIITSLNLDEGNMAGAGSTAATISNLEELEISIKVDEYSVLNTRVGNNVEIYIDSIGRTYNGTITWIANNATIENGVSYFKSTVEFTADEYVRGGMSVEVRMINAERKDAVSVSVDAINYRNDNTAFVYMLNSNGDLEETDVSLGVSDGLYIEVTEGLNDSDKIFYIPSTGLMFPMMDAFGG